jgi:hypothetical protein
MDPPPAMSEAATSAIFEEYKDISLRGSEVKYNE